MTIVWVSFIYLVAGGAAFADKGTTYGGAVLFYLVLGPITGAVVGLLRPIAVSAPGSLLVGVIAALPVSVGLVVTDASFPPWTREHTAMAVLISVFLGSGCGLAFHAFLRKRHSRNPEA